MACVKSVLWHALVSNVVDVSLSGGSLGYWTACNSVKRYCTVPYCEYGVTLSHKLFQQRISFDYFS